jgi:regulator of sirC expression with transglutaminase-like and TPR domain
MSSRGTIPAVADPSFTTLASDPDATLDRLALALAAEFRPVDAVSALARLDVLGAEVAAALPAEGGPAAEARACAEVLGGRHGFRGRRENYDAPEHSMLDLVLLSARGLPILLSAVYVETARRAGVALAGVGLPGHFVVGHFGADPPLLLDPFAGGDSLPPATDQVRPWTAHETALRMLNNLVASYTRRSDLGPALRAAELRLALPTEGPARAALEGDLRALRARLN